MTIEYRTPPEDLARIDRVLWGHQRLRRWLLLSALFGATVALAAGGVILALAGAYWGLIVTIFGVFLAAVSVSVYRQSRPSLEKVRKQRESEPWRDATYRVGLDDAGLTWEIPNRVSTLRWDGVEQVLDRDGFFFLFERQSAAALVFAIPHTAFAGEAALAEARELFRRYIPDAVS